jgi:hypothetical protein
VLRALTIIQMHGASRVDDFFRDKSVFLDISLVV